MVQSNGSAMQKINAIFDAGTFVELGAYTKRAGSGEALEGVVCGYGSVDGRLAFCFAQDSGREKGAFGEGHSKKIVDTYALAVKNGAPVIGVFDSAGATVYEGASALAAYGRVMKSVSDASGVIPQIAVIDGICGGMSAVAASMFDVTITINDSSKLYVNPPFIVGEEKGSAAHAAGTGLSAYTAADAEEAYAFARSLVSLLPSNNADTCMTESTDQLNRLVALEGKSGEAIITELADSGNFIRLYKEHTENAVLGFASFGGVCAGVVLVDGKLDIKVARVVSKLQSFCDSFGIPTLTLVDSEGLAVSAEAEDAAYASELARLAYSYTTSDNAKLTVVLGKAYGASFTLLGSKSVGADMVYALPNAAISVLSPEASVAFVWNDRVGDTTREELESEWREKCASAAEACDRGEVDDIIEPAELRKRICAALMMLASKANGVPTRRHANMPL